MKPITDLPRVRPATTGVTGPVTPTTTIATTTTTTIAPSPPSSTPADRFTRPLQSAPPVLTSFAAVDGGRGLGGTLALLRPVAMAVGVATFTPLDASRPSRPAARPRRRAR